MQNKPNFPEGTMSSTSLLTEDYENKSNPTLGENKPNSKPNKANCAEAKMSATVFFTRNYDNNPAPRLRQNKPNFKIGKMSATFCIPMKIDASAPIG
jgi:hypothetical protein